MAKNSYIKYVWLVDTIRRYGKATLAQLQDEWSRSSYNEDKTELIRRTFINHKEAVKEMFGIDIKVNGYNQYYIDNDGELDSLRNTMLDSFAVSNIFNMAPELKGRILFEEMPSGREYVVRIVEAMKMSRRLFVSYKKFGEEEALERICNPLALKAYSHRWYLIAQSKTNGWIYPLALDRIEKLEVIEESFTMPKDFDAEHYFRHCVGIIRDDDMSPEVIVFRTKERNTKYVRTLPFHSSQKELKTEGEWTYFELYVLPTFELMQLFLSQSDGLEVLEPKDIRDEIAKTIRKMGERY